MNVLSPSPTPSLSPSLGYLSLPHRSGKIRDISKCDYEFFGMTEQEANYTDVQMRLLLETTYEAIVDAGKSQSTHIMDTLWKHVNSLPLPLPHTPDYSFPTPPTFPFIPIFFFPPLPTFPFLHSHHFLPFFSSLFISSFP